MNIIERINFDRLIIRNSPDLYELHCSIYIVYFIYVFIILSLMTPASLIVGINRFFGLPLSISMLIAFVLMLLRSKKYVLNENFRRNKRLKWERFFVWMQAPFVAMLIILSLYSPEFGPQLLSAVAYNFLLVSVTLSLNYSK